MTRKVYDPSHKHPPEYERDLNPHAAEGINYGLVGPHPEKHNPRTAFDVKQAHRRLKNLTDDQLKMIPILPPGSRLEQDATYINLAYPEPAEFKALANMEVGPDDLIVPKSEVPYTLWNILRGITDPARTTEAVQGT